MEKLVHNVEMRVFAKDGEDAALIRERLAAFIPFDLEQEKLVISERMVEGFFDTKIIILTLVLEKQKHVSKFVSALCDRLSSDQKAHLLKQAESRLDDEMNFFIRFDKDKILQDNTLWVTDSGNCYHLRLTIAAYPAKRENALEVVGKIFS